jgi:hypothetical protein
MKAVAENDWRIEPANRPELHCKEQLGRLANFEMHQPRLHFGANDLLVVKVTFED